MFKIFFALQSLSLFLFGAQCDGIYLENTTTYNAECAALYVDMSQTDYSLAMAMTAILFGAIFTFTMIFAVLNVGKSWRI